MAITYLDIETAAHPDASTYLEPIEAPRNLRDPAKIAAAIAERDQERVDSLGLDWNVGRIIALGWDPDGIDPVVRVCRTEADERSALWAAWAALEGRIVGGFCVRTFDLPYMIQRSRLLGVRMPFRPNLAKFHPYSRSMVLDLSDELTFYDSRGGAMRHTLAAFARRFGIAVDDTTTGADVAALVAAGDYDAVTRHCLSDLRLTRELAEKCGVVPP